MGHPIQEEGWGSHYWQIRTTLSGRAETKHLFKESPHNISVATMTLIEGTNQADKNIWVMDYFCTTAKWLIRKEDHCASTIPLQGHGGDLALS